MKIAVESHIPFIRGVFEAAGHEVQYLEPEAFTPATVADTDALVIRTRTRCDAALLGGSRVRKIATATIGTDHIDLDYCSRAGIEVFNAPGCNAPAVAQYVLSTVARLRPEVNCLGIVGVGHVGSIVRAWAEGNGIATLCCDPPLGLKATLGDLAARCDVITFHTPLDATTRHMADRAFFDSLRCKPLIINAARGPVTDTPALIDALRDGRVSAAAIDCWEGEPQIDRELLSMAAVATPHIAGYSLEGKRRASAMAVAAIDPSIPGSSDPSLLKLTAELFPMPPVAACPLLDAIAESFDPVAASEPLRSDPGRFEALRNSFELRAEPR